MADLEGDQSRLELQECCLQEEKTEKKFNVFQCSVYLQKIQISKGEFRDELLISTQQIKQMNKIRQLPTLGKTKCARKEKLSWYMA